MDQPERRNRRNGPPDASNSNICCESSASNRRLAAVPGAKGEADNALVLEDFEGVASASAAGGDGEAGVGADCTSAGKCGLLFIVSPGTIVAERNCTPATTRKALVPAVEHASRIPPKVLLQKYLPKPGVPVIIPNFPTERAAGKLPAEPEVGFGLMFLSAVEILALHGLHVTAGAQTRYCVRAEPWAFFIA